MRGRLLARIGSIPVALRNRYTYLRPTGCHYLTPLMDNPDLVRGGTFQEITMKASAFPTVAFYFS